MHAYHPEVWDAQVKADFVREGDVIRFCQSLQTENEVKFNELAAKGGALYNICKTENRPPRLFSARQRPKRAAISIASRRTAAIL